MPRARRPAPDISQMTPEERFDRLFNRIMQAAHQGDTVQIQRFLPMALGRLRPARFGRRGRPIPCRGPPSAGRETPPARSPWPTRSSRPCRPTCSATWCEARRPVSRTTPRPVPARSADFLAHYDAEMKANRVEYLEHEPAIQEFRNEAGKVKGEKEER